ESFVKVQIQTNGTFITKDVISKMVRVHGINISLHGFRKIHDELTQITGSFEKALNGIRLVLEHDIPFMTNCVLTR
ncbi:MAG: hypothetical protein K6C34_01375, partial [Alphaproteobacteria bacterium]|nr:hypothetical protein [Alphaproteobacteria bacterium]